MLQVQEDGSGNVPEFGCSSNTWSCSAQFALYRDGSLITVYQAVISSGSGSDSLLNIPNFTFIDTGASATSHTYEVKYFVPITGNANTANILYMVLVAYEL